MYLLCSAILDDASIAAATVGEAKAIICFVAPPVLNGDIFSGALFLSFSLNDDAFFSSLVKDVDGLNVE